MYPEVQLGGIFFALIAIVVPLHGPCHSIVLMLPLLLLDLHQKHKTFCFDFDMEKFDMSLLRRLPNRRLICA